MWRRKDGLGGDHAAAAADNGEQRRMNTLWRGVWRGDVCACGRGGNVDRLDPAESAPNVS